MPDRRNADLFEILIGQVIQNIKINIVLSKALGVLLHTELFEPVRNMLHRIPLEFDVRSAPAGPCVHPTKRILATDCFVPRRDRNFVVRCGRHSLWPSWTIRGLLPEVANLAFAFESTAPKSYSAACRGGMRTLSNPSASVAEIVVRTIRRASCAGQGRPRCMVARLSHITTSPLRQVCT